MNWVKPSSISTQESLTVFNVTKQPSVTREYIGQMSTARNMPPVANTTRMMSHVTK
jgi:hypothetical protein